jgi:hypothetical protein
MTRRTPSGELGTPHVREAAAQALAAQRRLASYA